MYSSSSSFKAALVVVLEGVVFGFTKGVLFTIEEVLGRLVLSKDCCGSFFLDFPLRISAKVEDISCKTSGCTASNTYSFVVMTSSLPLVATSGTSCFGFCKSKVKVVLPFMYFSVVNTRDSSYQ